MTNNNFDNMTIEELKDFLKISEEKNQNLAKLLKDKSVESKNLKAEIDKQYELIGKLVEEKKELQSKILSTKPVDNDSNDALNDALEKNAILEEKNKKLEQELSELQNNNLPEENKEDNETSSLQGINNEVEKITEELNNKIEQVNILKENLAKAKGENDSLVKKNSEMQEIINNLNDKLNVNPALTLSTDKPNLLSRVVKNTLDLELNGYSKQDMDKLSSSTIIKNLYDDITNILKSKEINWDNKTKQVLEKLTDFINDTIASEASCFDYLVALKDLEKEYNDYKQDSQNIINDLSEKISSIDAELASVNNKEVVDINELNKTIDELNEKIRVLEAERDNYLSEIDFVNSKEDKPELINKFENLISQERNSHAQIERIYKNEIENLKEHNDVLNQELTKLSTDYLNLSIEKKLEELDDYVKKVKSGEIEYQSSLFNKYYLDALKQFEKQKVIYKDEIDKRDEILTKIFIEKNKELSRLENLDVKTYNLVYDTNIDINGLRSKISDLRLFVSYIDRILNTKVINIELESKKSIDEKIIDEFKEKINCMYKDMVYRINDNAYDYVEKCRKMTVNEVLDLYKKDCNEMAKFYAKEINQLYLINDVNSNEFSKLLNSAKIMMLCNEFYTLVNFKQSKYYQKVNGEPISDYTVKINDNFVSSLRGNEEIKVMLLDQKNNLESNTTKDINDLENEINILKDQIDKLVYQLDNAKEGINVKDINDELNIKKARLEKLNASMSTLQGEYEKVLEDINMKIALTQSNEKETKQIYLDRLTAISNGLKDIEKNTNDINFIYGMKKVNEYLYDLNAIDYAYINAYNQNDEKLNNIISEYQSKSEVLSKVILEYRDLVRLKNEYSQHAKDLKADYEAIREYEVKSLANIGLNRQLKKYEIQLKKAKENAEFGVEIDKNKDAMVMFHAKIISLKKQIEKSDEELSEIKNVNVISEYLNVLDKINIIDELIKNKEREI